MQSAKPTDSCIRSRDDIKLDKIQKLNRESLQRVRTKYTGKVTEHWLDGELKKLEVIYTKSI